MDFTELMTEVDAKVVDTLGVPTTVTTTAGAVHTVKGIFDKAYTRVDAGEAGVSSAAPGVFFRLQSGTSADKTVNGVKNYLPVDPMAETNLRVAHGGVTYVVQEVQKDGQGGVWLLLQKA